MPLTLKNIRTALEALDQELAAQSQPRDLIACGGGILSIMGVISRETRDLDVITPTLDKVLLSCSHTVARNFGLDPDWLNNGPSGFIRDLESGWELRTEVVFQGTCLIIKSLGRRDLIATKLQGMCDRDEFDLEDLLKLKPTESEIESLRKWLLNQDGSAFWPKRVESQLGKLLERIASDT